MYFVVFRRKKIIKLEELNLILNVKWFFFVSYEFIKFQLKLPVLMIYEYKFFFENIVIIIFKLTTVLIDQKGPELSYN